MSVAAMAAGAGGVSFRTPYLAWSYAPQDEQRFRKVLGRILLASLIACVAFTLLPRPKEERVVQEVPPRLAKLLLERDNVPPPATKAVPPKADPAQQRKAENDSTATPEPKRPEPRREAAKGAPVPEARNPIAGRPPGEIDAYVGTPTVFTPHLGPYDRGILSTIHVDLAPGWDESAVRDLLLRTYADEAYVRVCDAGVWPSVADVRGTNFCDIGLAVAPAQGARSAHAIVCSAIDNLTKGAAGQAVQCMNIRLGFPEGLGLSPLGARAPGARA